MKSENQNSTNGSISKGALGDKPASETAAKPAEHDLTAKAGPEIAVKAADPVVAKKS